MTTDWDHEEKEPMSEWAHGYNIEVPYTFGYYRETSKKTLQRLKQQDRNLLKEGKVIEDPQEEFEQMRNLIKGFLTEKVPTLKALSVI